MSTRDIVDTFKEMYGADVSADLKKIYSSATEEEAARELTQFGELWDAKYPAIAKSWNEHWPNIITLFDYPSDIRRIIYVG